MQIIVVALIPFFFFVKLISAKIVTGQTIGYLKFAAKLVITTLYIAIGMAIVLKTFQFLIQNSF